MIFDAHCDTMVKARNPQAFLIGGEGCHVDLPGLRKARVCHLVTALCVEPYPRRVSQVWDRGVSNFQACSGHTGEVTLHFALEGCLPVHLGLSMPETPLVASLTWNGDNPYGSGIGGTGGLTRAGRELARDFHARGTALDVSHLNDASRGEMLELDLPLCATHCNARSLCAVPRNLPDQDLRILAERGGVVGVTLVPDFLRDDTKDVTIHDVVRHMEHLAEIGGAGCVGLGSDFDGVGRLPGGIRGVEDLVRVFEELNRLGWTDDEVRGVSHANWLRFFSLNTEEPT